MEKDLDEALKMAKKEEERYKSFVEESDGLDSINNELYQGKNSKEGFNFTKSIAKNGLEQMIDDDEINDLEQCRKKVNELFEKVDRSNNNEILKTLSLSSKYIAEYIKKAKNITFPKELFTEEESTEIIENIIFPKKLFENEISLANEGTKESTERAKDITFPKKLFTDEISLTNEEIKEVAERAKDITFPKKIFTNDISLSNEETKETLKRAQLIITDPELSSILNNRKKHKIIFDLNDKEINELKKGINFIISKDSLESLAIINYLKRNSIPLIETVQNGKASWENLEAGTLRILRETKKANAIKVYGINLDGEKIKDPNFIDIKNCDIEDVAKIVAKQKSNNFVLKILENHCYDNANYLENCISLSPKIKKRLQYEDVRLNFEDLQNENIAQYSDCELTTNELFISANNKGYIPAMEKLAKSLNIKDEDAKLIIKRIREADLICQDTRPEMRIEANKAIENMEKCNSLAIVKFPYDKISIITDKLYYDYNNIFITTENKSNFIGNKSMCNELKEKFGGSITNISSDILKWEIDSTKNEIRDFVKEEIVKYEIDFNKSIDEVIKAASTNEVVSNAEEKNNLYEKNNLDR